jgi:membrane fusion protein (multidrug efflux system)
MFLTVQVALPNKPDSIVVPRNSITYTLYGESIFTLTPILDKDGKPKKSSYTSSESGSMKLVNTDQDLYKVGATNIKVLETYNNLALVSGIKTGVQIITSGQNKVRKGMNAVVDNSVKFKNDLYSQGI